MSLLQRVERANQSVEGAKAIAPEPVAPPAPPPDRHAAREEMLREIRLRLQEAGDDRLRLDPRRLQGERPPRQA